MLASPTDLPPPINHVFVDFENVHTIDLSVIGSKSVRFTLMLGAKQKRLDVELVEKLMEHAESVQLVRLTASGKNALDFALAYYVGRATMADPAAYIHIISKDQGFDPLIQHLRSRQIHAHRHDDFSSLTFSGTNKKTATPSKEEMDRVLTYLRKNTTNRPKRLKTLESHLLAFSGKNATEEDVARIIAKLKKAGHISLDEKNAVTYFIERRGIPSP
jgi:hypothetical protein